jgi:hypothetical protein
MKATGIPFQDTVSDCGVYLLGYMEKFLKNPRDMITKVLQRELNAERDWPELDANTMRAQIREVIFKVHEEQEEMKRALKKDIKASLKAPKQIPKDEIPLESDSLADSVHFEEKLRVGPLQGTKVESEQPLHSPEEHVSKSEHRNTREEQQDINGDHRYETLQRLLKDVQGTKSLEILHRLNSEKHLHPRSPRVFTHKYKSGRPTDGEILDIFKCCTLQEIQRFQGDLRLSIDSLKKVNPSDHPSSPPLQTLQKPLEPVIEIDTDLPSSIDATREQHGAALEDNKSDDGVQFVSARTTSPVAVRPKRKRRSSSERLQEMTWNNDHGLAAQVGISSTNSLARSTRSSQYKGRSDW